MPKCALGLRFANSHPFLTSDNSFTIPVGNLLFLYAVLVDPGRLGPLNTLAVCVTQAWAVSSPLLPVITTDFQEPCKPKLQRSAGEEGRKAPQSSQQVCKHSTCSGDQVPTRKGEYVWECKQQRKLKAERSTMRFLRKTSSWIQLCPELVSPMTFCYILSPFLLKRICYASITHTWNLSGSRLLIS